MSCNPESVTSIGKRAFSGCIGLTGVTIPENVNIGEWGAFRGCTNLAGVTISDSVTGIGVRAFCECKSLTQINIPKSVTNIGDSVFEGCSELQSINAHEDNPAYASIDGVLLSKDKVMLITCPEGKAGDYTVPDCVVIIDAYAFYQCNKLTSITIPQSVTNNAYNGSAPESVVINKL